MTNKHLPIGLFGGTFDPMHRGHITIAEELISTFELESMQFIPNNHPMYREEPVANSEHRLAMAKLATESNPQFSVSDIEIRRPGPTYTVDTLLEIRKKIPNQSLCLVLGADVFAKMNTWHDWETVTDLVHLLVINRPSTQLPINETWISNFLRLHEIDDAKLLQSKAGGYILRHQIEPLAISATEIRNKLHHDEDVSDQLDEKVLFYIKQHNLYR